MRIELALLLSLAIFAAVPEVRAQTTSIMNVEYPKLVTFNIGTQTADPTPTVTATVSFVGAKPGYFLAVGIFGLESGDLVGGSAHSYPEKCMRTSSVAGCIVQVRTSQGAEDVEFDLARPQSPWDLAIVTWLLNQSQSTIYDSFSDFTFTIQVYTALTLKVLVPVEVTVNVDGINESQGSARLSLVTGFHNVSIPSIVPVDDVTRLSFRDWSDGNPQPNRTVLLNHDVTLQADYVTQYRLQVVSPQVSAIGAGWYNQNSTAQFSVPPSPQLMSDWFGKLGGEWRFRGWFENGALLTSTQSGTVEMNGPRIVIARWDADYSVPLTIVAGVALGVIFLIGRSRLKYRKSRRRRRSAGA